MNMLIDAALSRTRTVLMLFALAMIMGTMALINIPKESTPDIQIPMVYVSINHEGISPEDADRLLYQPVLKELKSLDGVKEIIGTAAEGHQSIQIEFRSDADIDKALRDVREAVNSAKRDLPSDTDEPIIKEINLSKLPVLVVGLAGNVDERILFSVAKDLKERIEALPGVLEANVQGDRDEVAEIVIDPALMDNYNLDHATLFTLINNNNKLVAAGTLDTGAGRFALKVPGLIEDLGDILNMPIKVDGERVIRFGDIAKAQRTYKDPVSLARINGKPALAIEVSKRVGANIIDTLDQVKEVVKQTQPFWPAGIDVTFNQDQSKNIKDTLRDLFNNVLFATLLVVIVVVGSLGARSSFLVGLAIPGSFLMGILTLNLMGYTLNMVVLFALILSVGMLVDGAIVVTEYADRRLAEGASKRIAFAEASKRMAWPIIASTATTLAVFLPLLFWPDLVGEFMKFLPITVLITLSASLIMALIVVPAFGSLIAKTGPHHAESLQMIEAAEKGHFEKIKGFTGGYIELLKKALANPLATLGAAVALIVGLMFLYTQLNHGVEFFPDTEAEIGMVNIRARGNLSLDERDAIVKQVEQRLYDMPEIKTLYSKSFISASNGGARDMVGQVQMELENWQLRRPSAEIFADIRERTKDIPGIIIETDKQKEGPSSGAPIQIELTGQNQQQLLDAVTLIRSKLDADKDLLDIKDSRPLEGIEWQIKVDREQAARLGTDIASVGRLIQMVTGGFNIGAYRPDDADDEVDIRLRFPTLDRNLDQIDNLRVPARGELIPLSSFIDKNPRPQQGELTRNGSNLRYMIEANVKEDINPDAKRQELAKLLPTLQLPSGIQAKFRGDAEKQAETGAFLGTAFFLALFLMATILVTQFNSFYRAGLVLSAIIFSFVGVFMGLLFRGEPFGIVMSGVGMIALAGVVVNNNIILIDTYAVLRNQGIEPIEAALRTGAQRLRPVMLTTVTTVLGLVPMVFQLNIGLLDQEFSIGAPSSQWWTQLSTAIAGGLSFATLMTLFLTPCLLVLAERRKTH
ncbi:MAG: efflux RND transporter permease subunit [Oceanospirillaceae bacterium]|nr:efflux RND transporter permease subunit [Oceanospirillaceae bacterium]